MGLEDDIFRMLVDMGRFVIFLTGFAFCWILWNLVMAAFWGDEDEGTSSKRRPRSERRKKNEKPPVP